MNKLSEVTAAAMQKRDFFQGLVDNKASSDTLKAFLNKKGFSLEPNDLASLYLLINFGKVTVTAEEYLKILPTKQDTGGKGVWA